MSKFISIYIIGSMSDGGKALQKWKEIISSFLDKSYNGGFEVLTPKETSGISTRRLLLESFVRIDRADLIIAVKKDETMHKPCTFGDSTSAEIAYADKVGKRVLFVPHPKQLINYYGINRLLDKVEKLSYSNGNEENE